MLFSPISNLFYTNAMEISYNVQSVHPSLPENGGKEVSIQRLELYQYSQEEVSIRIDQFKSHKFASFNVSERHCKAVMEPMHK